MMLQVCRCILTALGEDDSIFYENEYKIYCDLNDDGKIDVNDVTVLQNYISMTV